MEINKTIKLNLNQGGIQQPVNAVQGDVGSRFLIAELFIDETQNAYNTPLSIPDDGKHQVQAQFYLSKSEEPVLNTCEILEYQKAKIKIPLTSTVLKTSGIKYMQIRILNDGQRVGSYDQKILVASSLPDAQIEGTNEFSVLYLALQEVKETSQKVEELQKASEGIPQLIAETETAIDNMEVITTDIQEKLDNGEFVGAQGEKGEQGIQGIQGQKGDTGEKGETGAKGEDGATFLPSVSNEGDLSWSNNKGLDNPDAVNIKGEKGDTGEQGLQGVQGVKGDTGEKGEKGDKGDQGLQGEKGEKGDTPTEVNDPTTDLGIANKRYVDQSINTFEVRLVDGEIEFYIPTERVYGMIGSTIMAKISGDLYTDMLLRSTSHNNSIPLRRNIADTGGAAGTFDAATPTYSENVANKQYVDDRKEIYDITYAGAVTKELTGSYIQTDDDSTSANVFQAFSVQGTTTQDHTPTPDNPSEIVGAKPTQIVQFGTNKFDFAQGFNLTTSESSVTMSQDTEGWVSITAPATRTYGRTADIKPYITAMSGYRAEAVTYSFLIEVEIKSRTGNTVSYFTDDTACLIGPYPNVTVAHNVGVFMQNIVSRASISSRTHAFHFRTSIPAGSTLDMRYRIWVFEPIENTNIYLPSLGTMYEKDSFDLLTGEIVYNSTLITLAGGAEWYLNSNNQMVTRDYRGQTPYLCSHFDNTQFTATEDEIAFTPPDGVTTVTEWQGWLEENTVTMLCRLQYPKVIQNFPIPVITNGSSFRLYIADGSLQVVYIQDTNKVVNRLVQEIEELKSKLG